MKEILNCKVVIEEDCGGVGVESLPRLLARHLCMQMGSLVEWRMKPSTGLSHWEGKGGFSWVKICLLPGEAIKCLKEREKVKGKEA